ncbi:hypothetical protein BDV98DRAFT_574500 [Pterulicium gracile]|uniref:Uncharacterized protein n=1 Tax=Pterulicium gracile TaxID=1884261 RepID=A0A5C3Q5S2_9AGAR|nr:hypothetical protein BDV98DRAFT_574500 [Pterula gracilis]
MISSLSVPVSLLVWVSQPRSPMFLQELLEVLLLWRRRVVTFFLLLEASRLLLVLMFLLLLLVFPPGLLRVPELLLSFEILARLALYSLLYQ